MTHEDSLRESTISITSAWYGVSPCSASVLWKLYARGSKRDILNKPQAAQTVQTIHFHKHVRPLEIRQLLHNVVQ